MCGTILRSVPKNSKQLSTVKSSIIQKKRGVHILGIDPGSRKMGYSVIEISLEGKIIYHECGVITCNVKAPLHERLAEMGESLEEVMTEYPFSMAAVEDVFSAVNIKSALILGQARGMVLYIVGKYGLELTPYAPTKIKKYITGFGRAPKVQVRKAVTLFAGLKSEPAEDAADALAAAICHAIHLNATIGGRR
jgi:crossover junction endodeoxyribonuclease RuvC